MTTVKNNTVRWPRNFSVRALTIAVTMVCVYFGAWDLTKRYGVAPPMERDENSLLVADERSPMPFVIRGEELAGQCVLYRAPVYYVWFFGTRFRLPLGDAFHPVTTADSEKSRAE